jgi:putative Mn2+ efflux pump MntP
MSVAELFLIALGLSMDAFAVSVSAGLSLSRNLLKTALVIGLYFGAFQALMPLLGYFAAAYFADEIVAYDHWIAFGLLAFLGGKMIYEGLKKEGEGSGDDGDAGNFGGVGSSAGNPIREFTAYPTGTQSPALPAPKEFSARPAVMLPLAVATSIDALVVGTSFAFLRVDIIPAVLFIGATTFLLSIVGVKIGHIFGARYKSKAVVAGGVILVLIGLKVLLEHLGVLE